MLDHVHWNCLCALEGQNLEFQPELPIKLAHYKTAVPSLADRVLVKRVHFLVQISR